MGLFMNRRHALQALAGLAICPLCASRSYAEGAHWSYEGSNGTDKWGDLDAANRVCSAGSQQSPIDVGGTITAQLSPLQIAWGNPTDTTLTNAPTTHVNFPAP